MRGEYYGERETGAEESRQSIFVVVAFLILFLGPAGESGDRQMIAFLILFLGREGIAFIFSPGAGESRG